MYDFSDYFAMQIFLVIIIGIILGVGVIEGGIYLFNHLTISWK